MRYLRLLLALFAAATWTHVSAMDVSRDEYVVFYHHDVLGSPVVVTDEKSRVLWYEHTQSYGSSLGRVGGNGTAFSDQLAEEADSRIGYTGHLTDNVAGLTYMKARHYDPQIGRFYSQDPFGFKIQNPMLFNRYAYANSNPYKYIDPDGRVPVALGWFATPPGIAFTKAAVTTVGALVGTAIGIGISEKANHIQNNESSDQSSSEDQSDSDVSSSEGKPEGLPENPDDLLERGYVETSHPDAAANGHRTFVNPETGDEVRHDKGEEGKPGHRGQDHYHRSNPGSTSRHDEYLDSDGNPTPSGSDASHLPPGT